jgi:hypothetical protein
MLRRLSGVCVAWLLVIVCGGGRVFSLARPLCRGTAEEKGEWEANPDHLTASELTADPVLGSGFDTCPYYDFIRPVPWVDEQQGGATIPFNDTLRPHCNRAGSFRHARFDAGCDMTPVDHEALVKYFFYDRTTMMLGDSLSHQHQKDLACTLWSHSVSDPITGKPTRAFRASQKTSLDLKSTVYAYKDPDALSVILKCATCYVKCVTFTAEEAVLPGVDIGYARVCFMPAGYPQHHAQFETFSTRWKDAVRWMNPRYVYVVF